MNHDDTFWHKATLLVPARYESSASMLLLKLAPEGLWLENKEEGRVRVTAFLPGSLSKTKLESVLQNAIAVLLPSEPCSVVLETVPEEAWQTAWQRHSIPIQAIGQTLQIVPPWEMKHVGSSDRHVICLSPGMAFGTGTHATTHNCLLILEDLILNGMIGPLLDVGTGSGLLAIAAAKLGVKKVTATEIDPVALEVAQKNARENRTLSKIDFRVSIPARSRYVCVVANLTTSVLLELYGRLTEAVLPGGTLILSGMLKKAHETVLERYQQSCFLIQYEEKDGWVTLLMQKKISPSFS